MKVGIILIIAGFTVAAASLGALNVSRACGSFPLDVNVSGTPLALMKYETCFDRATAEGYAQMARESDEDMRPGQRISDHTGRIDVPFSDVTSFFGLLTRHVQPRYAVIALTADDGTKRVRVVSVP